MTEPTEEQSTASEHTWSVHRIDDNGNVFLVRAHVNEAEAQRIVADFEAHGHKQTYWAEQDRAE